MSGEHTQKLYILAGEGILSFLCKKYNPMHQYYLFLAEIRSAQGAKARELARCVKNGDISAADLLPNLPRQGKITVYQSALEAAQAGSIAKPGDHYGSAIDTPVVYEITPVTPIGHDQTTIDTTNVRSVDKAWVYSAHHTATQEGSRVQTRVNWDRKHEFNLAPKQAQAYEATFKKNYESKAHQHDKRYALTKLFNKYSFSLWRSHRTLMNNLKQQTQSLDEGELFKLFLTTIQSLSHCDRGSACLAVLYVALNHLSPPAAEEQKSEATASGQMRSQTMKL